MALGRSRSESRGWLRGPAVVVAGLVVLALWAGCWTRSLHKDRLAGGGRTWIPWRKPLGLDFLSNYQASRHWQAGGNPYREPYGDPLDRPFIYPPVLLALFAWCRFFGPRAAVAAWLAVLAALAAWGAFLAVRTRRCLGLMPLPPVWVLVLVLCSTPIVFAMERGNCDLLVLLLLGVAAAALNKPALGRDLAAGACLALAAWIKSYAGLLSVGLLAARRPRAALAMLGVFVTIGLVDLPGTQLHVANTLAYVRTYDITFDASAHPLGTYWKHLWEGTRCAPLARIPGTVAAAGVLLPLILWVSLRSYRARAPHPLLFPYFAWLAAAATFFPPVSNDYNLFYLPLAALAVWDRRDPPAVHALLLPLLIWWQPIAWLPLHPELLFFCKLAGLAAVGGSLVVRAGETLNPAKPRTQPQEQALAPAA